MSPSSTSTSPAPTPRQPTAQGGPPLAPLAGVSLALLLTGLAVSAAMGGVLPSPFAAPGAVARFFARQPDAVHATAVFLFGASVPLALYSATASSRLRRLGVTAPGATIALAGGAVSAALLAVSGLLGWVLSRPEVRHDVPLVRALHDLSFLTGGVGHVVFLGLLIAGIAVPGLLLGLLPRPLAVAGLVVAAVAEISTVSLIWDGAAILAPIVRFPGLVWLIVAGAVLPRRRPHRSPADDDAAPARTGTGAR